MHNIEDSFVDKNRPVQMKYYDTLDRLETATDQEMEKAMKKLIKEDPDFLDPYLILHGIYQDNEQWKKADEILNEAYEHAIKTILDKKGNWPDVLLWGFMENRHIIRTIFNKGVRLWDNGKTDEALDIFRKLLKSNPNDNVGVRDFILAIRMGISFEEYEERFNKGGYYDSESIKWFEENAPKY
ncbi:MAG: tetratricopeptide repeat protein, partial [Balneolaceae bacterium]